MESNSLLPYKVNRENDYYYSFITKDGIVYNAYFLSLFECYPKMLNTYTFNIEPDSSYDEAKHPLDSRIALTIVSILRAFFADNKNSMIMVCDSVDGKEDKRRCLFNRWFDNYKEDDIIKLDAAREGKKEGLAYNLYVSLFININNPNRSKIIDAFNELVKTDLYELSF
ncbi:MAG: DUF6169 family protein [Prevotella sp.]|nr:DUF6169 family protein [Prevotella sp.]